MIYFIEKITIFIEKITNFIKRLFTFIPILWNNEDWDFAFALNIMKVKLIALQKCIKENGQHEIKVKNKIVRDIGRVINHIDHYQDIFEYSTFPEYDIEFEKLENGNSRMISKATKADRRKIKNIYDLENWHWDMIWRIIQKKGRNWWD